MVTRPDVCPYTARIISLKQLEAWSEAGIFHRDVLERIVIEIALSMLHGSSPAKALSAALKDVEVLFAGRKIRGEVHQPKKRHANFRLAFPTRSNEGLKFQSCLWRNMRVNWVRKAHLKTYLSFLPSH